MKQFLIKNRWYVLMNIFSLSIIFGVLWFVFKPAPLPEPVSRVEIQDSRELGLQWLLNNFEDGIFRYEYDPEVAQMPKTSNALRQLMGSRVAAVEAQDSEAFAEIHKENLEYIFANWYQKDANGSYVLYKDKSKLGSNAMLLRTLVYSPHFEQYQTQAKDLVRGIIALQNDDGSFSSWYVEPDYEYDDYYLLYFYSGEAMLALVEYYEKTGDESALQAAEKAADFYVFEYSDEIEFNYHPAYVPWHTMSYYHLFKLTDDVRYLDAVFTMNDRLLQLLDVSIQPGRFYKRELEAEGQNAPHSSSDAVYLEGLLYAYELAKANGEEERGESYKEAIDLTASRLVALQYQKGNEFFEAEPVTYVGAIPVREGNPKIRVDTTQHALDAFEKYLKVFELAE